MIMRRNIHLVRLDKWEERMALEARASATLARLGIPARRRYRCRFGSLPWNAEVVEREWESLAAMEADMAKRRADAEDQALHAAEVAMLISTTSDLYQLMGVESNPAAGRGKVLQRTTDHIYPGQWEAYMALKPETDAIHARLGLPPGRLYVPLCGVPYGSVLIVEREWELLEALQAAGAKLRADAASRALGEKVNAVLESSVTELYEVLE